jgi:hypothetical protein
MKPEGREWTTGAVAAGVTKKRIWKSAACGRSGIVSSTQKN